jgi:hypothetical protein
MYKYIAKNCWHPKLAKAKSGWTSQSDRVRQMVWQGVSCSWYGNRPPGILTASLGRSDQVTPSLTRIRSFGQFWDVEHYLHGKTSHPMNIKGRGRFRPIIQSNIWIYYFISPNPSFSNPNCSPPSSPRWLRTFWVAYRPQDNPRCTIPDGVPPRAAHLGFSSRFCPRRSNRPSRPQAVRPARARGFDEVIFDDRMI